MFPGLGVVLSDLIDEILQLMLLGVDATDSLPGELRVQDLHFV